MEILRIANTADNRIIFSNINQWGGIDSNFRAILRLLSNDSDWRDISRIHNWQRIFITNMVRFSKRDDVYEKLNEMVEDLFEGASEGHMIKVGEFANKMYHTLKYFARIENPDDVGVGLSGNTLVIDPN